MKIKVIHDIKASLLTRKGRKYIPSIESYEKDCIVEYNGVMVDLWDKTLYHFLLKNNLILTLSQTDFQVIHEECNQKV